MQGSKKYAFTLIELLTVIAIISLLAAIIFPVFARAKDSANRGADISSMNSIRTALQLYRTDQGGYPPALLGYVSPYEAGNPVGNIIPANAVTGFLYPKRVTGIEAFRPAYNRVGGDILTTAVYPNQDNRAVGTAPILDLDGNGSITPGAGDDPAGARQAFGPNDGGVRLDGTVTNNRAEQANYYKLSGYDVAEVPVPGGAPNAKRVERRYALFWTLWGLNNGNANDDPRQLGYSEPPDATVITWDSFFRSYNNNGVPVGGRSDIILFLGGQAKPYDTTNLFNRSWRVMP